METRNLNEQVLIDFYSKPQPQSSNKVLEALKENPAFIDRAKNLKRRLFALAESGNADEPENLDGLCWNCFEPDHQFSACPLRALSIVRFICFGCGKSNRTKKTCPDCADKRKAQKQARRSRLRKGQPYRFG